MYIEREIPFLHDHRIHFCRQKRSEAALKRSCDSGKPKGIFFFCLLWLLLFTKCLPKVAKRISFRLQNTVVREESGDPNGREDHLHSIRGIQEIGEDISKWASITASLRASIKRKKKKIIVVKYNFF